MRLKEEKKTIKKQSDLIRKINLRIKLSHNRRA